MADTPDVAKTERLPIPKERVLDDEKFTTVWKVSLEALPAGTELLSRIHSLYKELFVSIEHVQGSDLVLTVVRGRGTSCANSHLAAFFALARIEELAGPIAFIEGLPKEQWQSEFKRYIDF